MLLLRHYIVFSAEPGLNRPSCERFDLVVVSVVSLRCPSVLVA